jgi:hypothetical protein
VRVMIMRIVLAVISFLIFPAGWALGAWQIFRKKNRIFGSVLIGLATLELVLFILIGSSASPTETDVEIEVNVNASVGDITPVPAPTATAVPAPTATAVPASTATAEPAPTATAEPSVAEILDSESDVVTDDQISLTKMMFKAFDDVVIESEIFRFPDGQSYLLNITVQDDTNQNRITEVGDAFVRMLKLTGPDPDPGKEIGAGKFSYVVAVSNANETLLAQGLKCPSCTSIAWSYFP